MVLPRLLSSTLGLLAVVAGGCASPTHHYAGVTPRVEAAGKGRVVVATQDARSYVLSAEKPLSFSGVLRTAVGTPVNVTTYSDRPLAEDWTQSVCRALRQRGFEPVAVPLSTKDGRDAVIGRVRAAGGKAGLLLTIRDWKSDTYIGTSLVYDVTLEVIDPAGAVAARASVRGTDELGAQSIDTAEYARRSVLEAFQTKIQGMMNDPAVSAALK